MKHTHDRCRLCRDCLDDSLQVTYLSLEGDVGHVARRQTRVATVVADDRGELTEQLVPTAEVRIPPLHLDVTERHQGCLHEDRPCTMCPVGNPHVVAGSGKADPRFHGVGSV